MVKRSSANEKEATSDDEKEDVEQEEQDEEESNGEEVAEEELTAGQLVPIIIIALLFIVSIGFALVLVPIYVDMGFQADFEELGIGDEQSLLIPVFYIIVIVVFTAIILFITRKRKGRFIKYAFLGIICLSMVYVFTAISNAVLYPTPEQSWSNEVDIEGGVSTILIAHLVGDESEEIIVGTTSGNIEVYDLNLNLMLSTTPQQKLPAPIQEIAVADFNQDDNLDLIVVSRNVNIFEILSLGGNYEFNYRWGVSRMDINSLAVIPNYPIRVNTSIERMPAVIVSHSSKIDETPTSGLFAVSYYNNGYNSQTSNNISMFNFPINTIFYGEFNDSVTPELYLGSNRAIYSIDPIQPELPKKIISDIGNIIDIQLIDVDEKGANELIAYDENGTIYIYEPNKSKLLWKSDVGDHIGGIAFDDLFTGPEGLEMVVSVNGRVYIYYSDKDLFDERFEFTKESGRLDQQASGIVITDLDDNDELDILVGHSSGFKHYQYIWPVYSDIPCYIGLFVAILFSILLFRYPEWYIVDITGIIVAAGVTALIGISIGLLPIIVLLIILAIYDAISVYKTKHMVSLADKVMEFRLPILLVVPKKRGYSFLRQKGLKKQLEDGEEREAMFIGLGDIIIPGALVISAFHFLPVSAGWFGLSTNLLVAIFTLVGTLVGFSALMHYVLKGNPQAGLPLLNTGAILGFFISNFLIYQDLTFGMTLPFG